MLCLLARLVTFLLKSCIACRAAGLRGTDLPHEASRLSGCVRPWCLLDGAVGDVELGFPPVPLFLSPCRRQLSVETPSQLESASNPVTTPKPG